MGPLSLVSTNIRRTKASKIFFPVCVRFKADLSANAFASALTAAIGGDISQLVLAFRPSGAFGECELAQHQVIGAVAGPSKRGGSRGDQTVYTIQNVDGSVFSGKRKDITRKLGFRDPVSTARLIRNPGKMTYSGWFLKPAPEQSGVEAE